MIFADLTIRKSYLVHKQSLRALDNSKLSLAPNQNLIRWINSSRKSSSNNFLDLSIFKASNKYRSGIGRLLIFLKAKSELKWAVLATAPNLIQISQEQDMWEAKAHLDNRIGESLYSCWLSSLFIVSKTELTKIVCSKGICCAGSGQEAAEVWATCDAFNLIDFILERLHNFERSVNLLKLALDLTALALRVRSPSIEALVLSQQQVVVCSRSNLQDLAVLKLWQQKRRSSTV